MANVDVYEETAVLVLSLSAVLLAGGGGCRFSWLAQPLARGPLATPYVKGELKATEQASLDRTWAARSVR